MTDMDWPPDAAVAIPDGVAKRMRADRTAATMALVRWLTFPQLIPYLTVPPSMALPRIELSDAVRELTDGEGVLLRGRGDYLWVDLG
jgi:hypothetical protein